MKLKNGEIFNAKEPLNKLMAVKLPVKTSYELAQLAHKLKNQIQIIDEVRDRLIATYGKPATNIPGGSQITPADEGFPKFAEELGELLDQEIEIEFNIVKLPPTLEIEPYVLMALDKFVELEEVESKK